MKELNVAVVGATGAVGTQMIKLLEKTELPIRTIKFLASKRSAGKSLSFKGNSYIIEELVADSFDSIDVALFSAGGSISEKFAPEAVKRGAVVIDNTSHFRMDPTVPLVVPEVNPGTLSLHQGIIANPNCSTIQMMVALEPIRQAFGLERVIVSTYQAVSGAGNRAVEELKQQTQAYLEGQPVSEWPTEILPTSSDVRHYPLAFNALPQIDVFAEEDYTYEEWKMIHETKKIMADDAIKVAATCVRIPVIQGHSESIYIETSKQASPDQIRELMKHAPGVVLQDDPKNQIYPQALDSVGRTETFVGRIRKDPDEARGLHLWVVSDNLLKGAAWNAIQIAEEMHSRGML